jgi:holo-[acyl-carrier protein] synthase
VTEIGTDLVDVDRFRRVLMRRPGLVERLFTENEQRYAAAAKDPAERLAVRFAAKEAVMKALGCGLGAVRMVDIEVIRDDAGNPSLVLHGSAAERAFARGLESFNLSMTHTHTVAHAMVVAE